MDYHSDRFLDDTEVRGACRVTGCGCTQWTPNIPEKRPAQVVILYPPGHDRASLMEPLLRHLIGVELEDDPTVAWEPRAEE